MTDAIDLMLSSSFDALCFQFNWNYMLWVFEHFDKKVQVDTKLILHLLLKLPVLHNEDHRQRLRSSLSSSILLAGQTISVSEIWQVVDTHFQGQESVAKVHDTKLRHIRQTAARVDAAATAIDPRSSSLEKDEVDDLLHGAPMHAVLQHHPYTQISLTDLNQILSTPRATFEFLSSMCLVLLYFLWIFFLVEIFCLYIFVGYCRY